MKIILLFAFVLLANPAHAYIDAGTGSMVIQFFVAAVAGAAFTIKSCWHSIKAFFAKKGPATEAEAGSIKSTEE